MKRTRRQKSPEARRTDIMSAAETLFIEQGVASTRIEDIATAANIGKGTLYLYFRSKEDLLAGLHDSFVDYFMDRIDAHLKDCSPTADHRTRLSAWLKGCLDGFYDKASLHNLVFHTAGSHALNHRHENPAVSKLECILSNQQPPITDAAFIAAIIFNAVHGAVEYAATRNPPLDKETLLIKIEALLTKLLPE